MNKSTKHNIINNFKIIILSLIITVGVGYTYAQVVSNEYSDGEWTPPQDIAPSGNTPAPINVGSLSQVKAGGFGAANILTAAFQMTGGNPALNKVLVSTNNEGNATWKDLSEVGGSGSIVASGEISINETENDSTNTTVSISAPYDIVVMMTGYGESSRSSDSGVRETGIEVTLKVDGVQCAVDNSFEGENNSMGYKASATCIKKLDAKTGGYVLKMEQLQNGVGVLRGGSFQYVVFKK